jgi:hypothetical protein
LCHLWIRICKISVLPGTTRRWFRRLEDWPVAAVNREREAALGKCYASLVEHEAVGAGVVNNLREIQVLHTNGSKEMYIFLYFLYLFFNSSGTPPVTRGGGGYRPYRTLHYQRYWPNRAGLLLISSGQVPEMAAHPYSGSFSTSDATNGQSPFSPHFHTFLLVLQAPSSLLPKLWQTRGPERWRQC